MPRKRALRESRVARLRSRRYSVVERTCHSVRSVVFNYNGTKDMRTSLIEALQNPDRYPHRVDRVELLETHISWVLLAGDRVYKLKKPLNLGFLDFSTLERRRFFCEEELRLNQRTAPDLYLDVVAIRGTPENPSFEGTGEVIEYAVRMRRFGADAGFDQLLSQHRLRGEHIIGLGRKLAELHRIAGVAGPDSNFGTASAAAEPIRDNFTDLARTLKDAPVAQGLTSLQTWTEAEIGRLAPLMEQRHRDGFIRECHGDAHLGNVALINGEAILFDCVEFSSELRWIDLISDVAFAVMDLHRCGEQGFAWLLLDEYLAVTGDYRGLQLLPLYMVHRALVRAKVTALRLEDTDIDRDALLNEVHVYLELARKISSQNRPVIIITMGLSGSGKSWLAQQLVERVGLVRLRSDVERKRLHGVSQSDSSDSAIDSDLYSTEATQRTYRHLAEMARPLIDAGIPCLIDAACLKHWQRGVFRELASELGVPFGILHCHAGNATLRQRIVAREAVGNDPSEAGLEVLEHQQQTLEALNAQELTQALLIDTGSDIDSNSGDNTASAADWVSQLTLDGIGHIAAT